MATIATPSPQPKSSAWTSGTLCRHRRRGTLRAPGAGTLARARQAVE